MIVSFLAAGIGTLVSLVIGVLSGYLGGKTGHDPATRYPTHKHSVPQPEFGDVSRASPTAPIARAMEAVPLRDAAIWIVEDASNGLDVGSTFIVPAECRLVGAVRAASDDSMPRCPTPEQLAARHGIEIKAGPDGADTSNLSDEMTATFDDIALVWKAHSPGVAPVITDHRPDSRHYTGNAIDLRTHNLTRAQIEAIARDLQVRLAPQEPLPFRQRFLPQPKPSWQPVGIRPSLRRPKSDRLPGRIMMS